MPIGEPLADQQVVMSTLLWGREGTGKTTSALRLVAAKPKGNVVVINAEAGAKKLALEQHGIDSKRIEIWPPENKGPGYITHDTIEAEVINPLRDALAKEPGSYIGLVVDSFSEVARRILEDVVANQFEKAQRLGKNRDRWSVTLEDHGIAASQMRSLLRRVRDLNIHLVLTALERRDVDEKTSAVTYGPALGPSVGNDTMGLVDLVGFCQVEHIGDEDFRTATFMPTQTRRAKDRYGLLPPTMVDPYADRIIGYIEGKITRENDPSRKRLLTAAAASNEQAPPSAPANNGQQPADNETAAPAAEKESVNA